MSTIKIYFNPLDAGSCVKYSVDSGVQLIDFLQEHYPVGFNGVLKVFVNQNELQLENLDYTVGEEDTVIMLVMPGAAAAAAAWSYIAPYLVQALVSLAIGLIVGLIFRPSRPDGFDSSEESPVYSINASRNRARVNEPVAVHYGSVSWPPDFASAPYIYYDGATNDMFVDELLCIGQGYYSIDDIFIGDTPASTLEVGALQYWIFSPDDHGRVFGNIESTIWDSVKDGPNPFPFIENMFTSPEVENWEFNKDVDEVPTGPIAISGAAVAAVGANPGYISGVDSSLDINPGSEITLSGTVSNNITFSVGSVVVDPDNAALMTIFEVPFPSPLIQDEPALSGTYTLDAIVDNMVAGPFRAQKIGQTINQIDCDILFPQGLMTVEGDGDQRYREITMEFTYQQINETTGAAIGAPIVQTKMYRAKTRSALRDTYSSGPLTEGSYEVTVKRLTDFAGRGLSPETTVWSGLKGRVVHDLAQDAYGPVTLMAVRMKATNGLGQAARARVRVTATRVLEGGAVESTNPITVIKDIFTNTDYGMGRQLTEANTAELDILETAWGAANGPKFNGSFDQRGTGWDAMQNVVSMAGARVIQHASLVTVVPDQVQPVRSAMFASANIAKDSLEIGYTFDTEGNFEGVRVEYRDPFTYDPKYVFYPTNLTEEQKHNTETFILFGCTDPVYAQQYAAYMWNVRSLRRKTVKFKTELEGLIPRFGDRIGVAHAMPDWGQSGVIVRQLSATKFQVDSYLDWAAENYVILRDDKGEPTAPLSVTMGEHRDLIVFAEAPPITIHTPYNREPTIYTFGRTNEMIKDFIVTRTAPGGELSVQIEGQLYDETIYTGAPPHMGG